MSAFPNKQKVEQGHKFSEVRYIGEETKNIIGNHGNEKYAY